MNLKVDSQNVIQFPNLEWKTSRVENFLSTGGTNESFSKILDRQISDSQTKDSFVASPQKDETREIESQEILPKEQKSESAESKNETIGTDEPESVTKESEVNSHDETEVSFSEEELEEEIHFHFGEMDLASYLAIQSANQQVNEVSKEKTILLSLQKNAEKTNAYQKNEIRSFIEDTKTLAEGFFKKQLEIKANEDHKTNIKDLPVGKPKDGNVVLFPNIEKKEVSNSKKIDLGKESNLRSESLLQNSKLVTNISNQPKENQVLTKKLEPEAPNKKNSEKTKSQKSQTLSSDAGLEKFTEPDKVMQNGAEKLVRSLGVKDKEFNKQDLPKQIHLEKPKVPESFVSAVESKQQFSSGEDGQKSSDDRLGKHSLGAISFDSKHKLDSIKNADSLNKPKEATFKQNLDDLIKQAKFDIVQNGKSSAEIVMNPKEYGRLTLKVSVDGDKVEGRILVESEEIRNALQNEIQNIKENLKQNGLELESLLVDLWDNGNSSFAERKNDELDQVMRESAKLRLKNAKNESDQDDDIQSFEYKNKSLEFFA
ncbi:flagellar hook-length control protein FliK [Leptospira sp. 96542]|nr:flagellar hook-length control protein FliK [Leptospira sp. 96542]